MAYVALYRKYRSQNFGEVIGQEAVTTTLQNQIKTGRIAHAYLFHGARGCGKTSTARLLARALNCVAQDGPTPTPCGQCRLCVAIRDGSCMDVVEIDAASETSIDDVREKIIENVQYAPAEARYKVYIIDEVHDLSAKAFDALLKTLEEPPAHVIFVLATTEWHKVPITIRSRCQPFQFKRGSLQDLASSIQHVIDGEGYTADPEAVLSIARAAEGSWRDALSLLEQVLAYSDGKITGETVHRAIGSVGSEALGRVVETLAKNEWDSTLAVAGELLESGTDVRQLLTALTGYLRDLLLVSVAKGAAQKEMGAERVAILTAQTSLFAPASLRAMISELMKAEREIRFTNQHRWLLESVLLGLMPCNMEAARGETVTTRRSAGAASTAEPAATPPPPRIASTPPTVVPRPPTPAQRAQASDEYRAASDSEEGEPEETPPPPATTPPARPAGNPAPAPEIREAESVSDTRFADAITLDVIQRAWPRILKQFERISPSGAPFLKKAQVVNLEGQIIILEFPETFARDRIQNNDKGRARVEQTINETLRTEGLKIRCILGGQGGSGVNTNGNAPTPSPSAPASPTGESGMAALLDVPIEQAAPPPRQTFGDVGPIVRESPPASTTANGNGAQEERLQNTDVARNDVIVPRSEPPALPEIPVSNGLLAATLELFGGEVVRTEPINT